MSCFFVWQVCVFALVGLLVFCERHYLKYGQILVKFLEGSILAYLENMDVTGNLIAVIEKLEKCWINIVS